MAERKNPDPQSPRDDRQPKAGPDATQHEYAPLPSGVTPPLISVQGEDARDIVVSFQRRSAPDPEQAALWNAIRLHTEQIGFSHFAEFIRLAFCTDASTPELRQFRELGLPELNRRAQFGWNCPDRPFAGYIPGADLYAALKLAAEVFLLLRCGVCHPKAGGPPVLLAPDGAAPGTADNVFGIYDAPLNPGQLDEVNQRLASFLGSDPGSYIRSIVQNVFGSSTFKVSPFCSASVGLGPCMMELIWSYWHEQGMLVQTTNALALRFQNVARSGRDPLAELELDPLRPLNGFLWGYVRDEPSRLSVSRRAYEYHHEYGLSLAGRAATRVRPVDSRSKFLQGFHDLLRLTDQFYRDASDHTVTPDPFPLLIALRDLHMILAEGAHNQFRDLPWTARSEMLVQQWLLAREETRDFLRGRLMTPYPEGWMGAVDAMKRLQGWGDTSVIHFSDLAKFGERLLLSVRHVRWDVIADPFVAQDWAFVWRPEIQGYIHAYRMVTGIMLSDDIVELNSPDSPRYLQPAVLLRDRLLQQRRNLALPPAAPRRVAAPSRTRLLPRS